MPLVNDISKWFVLALFGSGLNNGVGVVAADLRAALVTGACPGDTVRVGVGCHHLGELTLALGDNVVGKVPTLGLGIEGKAVGGLAWKKKKAENSY